MQNAYGPNSKIRASHVPRGYSLREGFVVIAAGAVVGWLAGHWLVFLWRIATSVI